MHHCMPFCKLLPVYGLIRFPIVTISTSFQPVLTDPTVANPDKVDKVVFVSGKLYYTLSKHFQENGVKVITFK